jgi:TM2 domain-containing membrane protein YozV
MYLLFCWTMIPGIIAFIEGILYLTMSDEAFEDRYLT